MHRILPALALVLITSLPIHANVCAIDQVPAATLLFPFVVFDYNNPWGGETSILSITNTGYEAQVVKVVLWSDLGDPVLAFNLLLSGYDSQRFNLRDILVEGRLPVTVSEGHSSSEVARDYGPVSGPSLRDDPWAPPTLMQPEATFFLRDRCGVEDPGYPGEYVEPLPGPVLDLVGNLLTMTQRAWIGANHRCDDPLDQPYEDWQLNWYADRDESAATWMYVTADVVEHCSTLGPEDEGYWVAAEDGGQARYDNVLTGAVWWVSSERSTAMPAVALEAHRNLAAIAAENPANGLPVSFNARLSNNVDGTSDLREPLPTAWSLGYFGEAWSSTATSSLLVWKGSTLARTPPDLTIVGDASPEELIASSCNAYTYYAWDEDSNVFIDGTWAGACYVGSDLPGGYWACPNLLPFVVQEIPVDYFRHPLDVRGWMLFVWPPSNYPPGDDTPPVPDLYQTWMGTRTVAWDTHADFQPGWVMANANCFPEQVLPDLGRR